MHQNFIKYSTYSYNIIPFLETLFINNMNEKLKINNETPFILRHKRSHPQMS